MTIAKLARDAAIKEVFDAMEAHGRYHPAWEVQELGVNYAIRNRLSAYFRNFPPPSPRVCCEYGVSEIKNVNTIENIVVAADRGHPIDLAVLYPIEETKGDATEPGSAWAPQNCAVLGLIEVKKDSRQAKSDVSFLSTVLSPSTGPANATASVGPIRCVYFGKQSGTGQ